MADDNTIIEGFVKFREGKKVSLLNSNLPLPFCLLCHFYTLLSVYTFGFIHHYEHIDKRILIIIDRHIICYLDIICLSIITISIYYQSNLYLGLASAYILIVNVFLIFNELHETRSL